VTVADTGRGVSADEAGRIFNDFYTTKPGGTGLGLSIVRRLVMDLHGTLGVDSAPGRGTRVIIDIPAGGPSIPLRPGRSTPLRERPERT
jgi:two-component system sensor histidine kinase HydH